MIVLSPESNNAFYRVQFENDPSTGFHEAGVVLSATGLNRIDADVLGVDEDFADSVAELGRCLAQAHDQDSANPAARVSKNELAMLGLALNCFTRRTNDLLTGPFALTGSACSTRRLESYMALDMAAVLGQYVTIEPIEHIDSRHIYLSWIPTSELFHRPDNFSHHTIQPTDLGL
jgi:hypothetical protein